MLDATQNLEAQLQLLILYSAVFIYEQIVEHLLRTNISRLCQLKGREVEHHLTFVGKGVYLQDRCDIIFLNYFEFE